jgi:lactate dehydrogenase-like 2-hydroxyacid dehydrogenase
MTGKTLGLIGFGRIAQRTAAFASGFGMTILYHSRSQAPAAIEQQLSAKYCGDLTDLLERSDFVSLHCPGGPATDGLMNAQRLGQMRSTAFLVNTARGSVIDDIALAAALHDGAIAGAALDVFRGEPLISKALLGAPNLVMLPHLGSATTETRTAMGLRALANLQRWAVGKDLLDRVA